MADDIATNASIVTTPSSPTSIADEMSSACSTSRLLASFPDHCSTKHCDGGNAMRAARRILRSLNRGWNTPDPRSSNTTTLPDILAFRRHPTAKSDVYSPKMDLEKTSRAPAVFAATRDAGADELKIAGHGSEQQEGINEGVRRRTRSLGVASESASIGYASLATSSLQWMAPENVLIFFDWDDTLFPTSWLTEKGVLRGWKNTRGAEIPCFDDDTAAQLNQLDWAARALLMQAKLLGHVCCVTLSTAPWQQTTMEAFMPELAKTWKSLGIEVLYATQARGILPMRGVPAASTLKGDHWDVLEATILVDSEYALKKQRCMKKFLSKVYGDRSWKHVVSIGDGDAECQAVREIAFQHTNPISGRTGEQKQFRCKSVKTVQSPDCEQLTAQLQVLHSSLPVLISLDRDFDISWRDAEDTIVQCHEHLFSMRDEDMDLSGGYM